MVVVVRPETVEAPKSTNWGSLFQSLAVVLPVAGLSLGLASIAVSAFQNQAKDSDFDGELLILAPDEAAMLKFPVGHPRKKVVYMGHPLDAPVYVPVAQFHSFLFEHKVAEAQRMLRNLGAETITIVRVSGWSQVVGLHANVPIPGIELGASAEQKRGAEAYIESKITLQPTADPFVPDDLVWFPHEPLWQELAAARLQAGMTSFELEVRSTDDYGVNAGLKVMIEKSGLDVGGDFVKHEKTVWQMKGTFARL